MEGFDLNTFAKNRQVLLTALLTNAENFAVTFYTKQRTGFFDRRIGTFSPYLTTNEPQLCCFIFSDKNPTYPSYCYTSNVSVLGKGKTGQVLFIETPDRKKYALKYRTLPSLGLEYSNKSPTSIKDLLKKQQRLDVCFYPHVKDYGFIAGDEFSIEVIIPYILESVYAKNGGISSGLNGYTKYFSATICDVGTERYGLNLLEYAAGGDVINFFKQRDNLEPRTVMESHWSTNPRSLNVLRTNVIIDILKQIITNLHFLQNTVQLIHGDLKPANILVSADKANINYQNIRHTSPVTYKLADFGRSSLTLSVNLPKDKKTIRIYNSSSIANAYLAFSPFEPKVDVKMNVAYYELNLNLNASILALARHAGVPFFSSFDTITFMTSLLLIPEVFYAVFTTPILQRVMWDSLWLHKDHSKMYDKLYKMVREGKEPSYDNTLTLLRGARIKCSLTNDILEQLKTI